MRHSTRSSFVAVVLLFCILIIPHVMHAQAFEGTITMQMASPMLGNQKIDMLSMVKGNKVLQIADDPKQGKISIYTDLNTGTQIIVMEAQKQGMLIDQAMIDQALKSMNMPVLVPILTGKKQKIAGYDCELYTIAMDSVQEMDIWLTKDFPKDLSVAIRNCTEAGMKTSGVKSEALLKLFQKGYGQVRMEMKYKGVTQLTNEFAKAEAKKLDDAMFTVPSDIKVERFDPSHRDPGIQGK